MSRERLPNRRPSFTHMIALNGIDYLVSIGLSTQGRALEVFIDGLKVGSAQEKLLDDTCIVISRLLQLGDRPHKIMASIEGRDCFAGDRSIVGAVLEAAIAVEQQAGGIVRELEAQREIIASAYA